MAVRIKKGDTVRVIRGNERGKQGKVLRVLRDAERIVIENVNYIKKHLRRSQEHPQGGRIEKEAALPLSNVMVVCPACKSTTRVGIALATAGDRHSKTRVCRKCQSAL